MLMMMMMMMVMMMTMMMMIVMMMMMIVVMMMMMMAGTQATEFSFHGHTNSDRTSTTACCHTSIQRLTNTTGTAPPVVVKSICI